MKERIWITGAAGFVGSQVASYFLKKNYEVHVFVRPTTNLWRLEPIKKQIVIHKGILDEKEKITKLAKKYPPSYVFHLASYGAYHTQKSVDESIQVNIKIIINLIEGLRGVPVKKFVITSSSSEYGKKESVMKESDLLEPVSYYAITKAAQTYIAQMYAVMEKTPITILRLFNVYGPLEEEGRLVRNVITACLSNQPVKLATGKEARDFIYVDDVCNAFLKAMKPNVGIGKIYNVGTGVQTTIEQLSKLIKKLTNSISPIMLNAYEGREWDNTHWKAYTKKSKNELGFVAKTSLSEGIIKTIEWYKAIKNSQKLPAK